MDRNLGASSSKYGDPKTHGLLYQWGRKDPFVSNNISWDNVKSPIYNAAGEQVEEQVIVSDKTPDGAISNNLAYSINYPLTHIAGINNAASQYDWYTAVNDRSAQRDDLWATIGASPDFDITKSIFDPCPNGWRVPANGVWSGITSGDGDYHTEWNSNGYIGNGASILPSGVTPGIKSTIGYYPAAGYRAPSSGNYDKDGSSGYYWTSTFGPKNAYRMNFTATGITASNYNSAYRGYSFSVRCVKE